MRHILLTGLGLLALGGVAHAQVTFTLPVQLTQAEADRLRAAHPNMSKAAIEAFYAGKIRQRMLKFVEETQARNNRLTSERLRQLFTRATDEEKATIKTLLDTLEAR